MSETVSTTEVPVQWVLDNNRLDASYFAQEGIEARVLLDELEDNDIRTETLDSFTQRIFKESRFKRNYVEEGKEGAEPYLTPTDMFTFPIKERKYIKNPPDGLKSEPGWILITRSGTVGRTIVSNKFLSEYILSDDLIRAVPTGNKSGYVYAYLNTWVGQALLTKDEFGATVKHIDPHQVEKIRIPHLPQVENEIDQKIIRANNLRKEAHQLLHDAENLIYEQLSLSRISESKTVESKDNDANTFRIRARNLENRLDASYHTPDVHTAIEEMETSQSKNIGKITKLEQVANSFVPPRFTRVYVEERKQGIPMLQGSHVDQIEPQGLEYIWKNMDNVERYIIEKDMILVTCSGTVGDLCLVSEHQDDWAATNHLIRIIPEQVRSGYLVAFLMSEYGQVQFERLTYGGVVDEIGESGELVDDIKVFVPSDESIINNIGKKVKDAYKKRDSANKIESEAIELFESRMRSLRSGKKGD
jgi:type I restriction enzyme S subunit